MPSDAVLRFIEQAERLGLLSADSAGEVLRPLAVDPALTTDAVAAHMVQKKVLTAFQAERLLAGRGADCSIAGRYQLLEKLGEGGMGAVFKARDIRLDRLVALKVLPAGRLHDADAVARFQREAKALARLAHPHIIQAFDSGHDGDRHFLVMEYVQGVNLQELLRGQGALAPTLAADLIHQTALGLQHAHEKGLIHRDLKPANLLVAGMTVAPATSAGLRRSPSATAATVEYVETPSHPRRLAGPAQVKILDLGLARFLQDQLGEAPLTQEGIGMGTPDYMAPEQFRDAVRADARTDIYGLGCTLYHMIGGQPPFPGSSYAEKAHAHAKKEPIPLEERCPEVPAGLAFVVQKMMAKHPAERFPSAGEVAAALEPYVAGKSHSVIQLRQTGKWPPGRLTMAAPGRTKRALAWAAGIAGAAVFAVLLVFAWPAIFSHALPSGPAPDARPAEQAGGPATPPAPAQLPRVVTIENGVTVAHDGTGQYATIKDALNVIKPGQTIRILDDAIYNEVLAVADRTRHAGITLESPKRAMLTSHADVESVMLTIQAPRVTVRGFRILLQRSSGVSVFISNVAPGIVLDSLAFDSRQPVSTALHFEDLNLGADDEPVVVKNCSFDGFGKSINFMGKNLKSGDSVLCRRVLVHDNRISNTERAVMMMGSVRDVALVGNRMWNCHGAAFTFMDLFPETSNILIANNSIMSPHHCIEIRDPLAPVNEVLFGYNVILTERGPDLAYLGRDAMGFAGWHFQGNWRQVKLPEPSDPEFKQLIPTSADKIVPRLSLRSYVPAEPGFLQPEADSPLATAGASGDLPRYVGAVPPVGAEPWNWRETWKTRMAKPAR